MTTRDDIHSIVEQYQFSPNDERTRLALETHLKTLEDGTFIISCELTDDPTEMKVRVCFNDSIDATAFMLT